MFTHDGVKFETCGSKLCGNSENDYMNNHLGSISSLFFVKLLTCRSQDHKKD